MKVRKKIYALILIMPMSISAFLYSAGSYAHHSFAMYDNDKHIRLTGTVTHFQWTNPHVYIELEVEDEAKGLVRWTIECANPGILSRIGWKFNMIKEEDKITVIVGPLRTGQMGALLKQVKLANGTIMGNGGPAGEPNIPID